MSVKSWLWVSLVLVLLAVGVWRSDASYTDRAVYIAVLGIFCDSIREWISIIGSALIEREKAKYGS